MLISNYKWCKFILRCRAIRASKHPAYTSIVSRAELNMSNNGSGMLNIEIQHILLFVCHILNLHKSWNPSAKLSNILLFNILNFIAQNCLLLGSRNITDRFHRYPPRAPTNVVVCLADPANLLPRLSDQFWGSFSRLDQWSWCHSVSTTTISTQTQ